MRIAITGTRGVPNHYGGFEQFAEFLSVGLVKLGHHVTVYNSHKHPYQKSEWNGVKIIHCTDPEEKLGTGGQFIYDLNCILDTRKKKFDIILQLGYTSSSIWGWLLPRKKSVITTNMDGLEWKRTKFSKPVQKFLKFAEKLGIKYSDHLISDSVGIQEHIQKKYQQPSVYIPYGAHAFENPTESILTDYKVSKNNYNMLIARLEPENSIEIILDGVADASKNQPFLVIGNHKTTYGEYLKNKYHTHENIWFLGGIYNLEHLNNLRNYSNVYFHGHTVGGTNPSLLEAMASNAFICANDNIFNKSILGEDAVYFKNHKEVSNFINVSDKNSQMQKVKNNLQKIKDIYSWEEIIDKYLVHFKKIMSK
jgi:glycosyltransferase involved in cell wall biosynthesis